MWNLLLPALAIAGGTYLGASANANAANTATAGIQNAANIQQSTDAQIAANGGVGPGASYLRSLIVQPQTLTPAQQSQLADLRTSTANQLHGSDFAGSGQTAAALFKKTEDNFVNDALSGNQQKAIGAADRLAGTSTQAALQGAQAGSTAATAIGNIDANAGLATGKLYGQALGDVGSLITKQSKLQTLS